jgi:vacuolar-type H+-ATPase subunit H
MLEKLLELFLSAKAGAVSGVIILAGGALVTTTAGNGVTTVTIQLPTTTPIVEVVEPDVDQDEDRFTVPVKHPSEKKDQKKAENAPTPPEISCEDEAHARNEARQRVQDAFKKYHTGVEQLRNELGQRGSASTHAALKEADDMLKEIAGEADRALQAMSSCGERDGDETEDDEEQDGEDADEDEVDQASANVLTGDAASMQEIADSAIEAMAMVYDIAKSTFIGEKTALDLAAKAKPTSKPTSKAKATPKPSKRPTCDDQVYAAKKVLSQAFDQFHGGNDKLIYEVKSWADERTTSALKAADKVLHETYDRAKEAILKSGCATGDASGVELAKKAAAKLEQTYSGSKALYQVASANKPNKQACTEQMYAAKKVLQAAYDRWHGANDKLYYGIKSFSSENAIRAVKSADEVIHKTYDQTRDAIVKAACTPSGSNAMDLAKKAAATLEQTHIAARQAVAAELAAVPAAANLLKATPTPKPGTP